MLVKKRQDVKRLSYILLTVSSILCSADASGMEIEEDKIINAPRFAVAVEQEGAGEYDLANYNYHLALGEDTRKDFCNTFNTNSRTNLLLEYGDAENLRNAIKKDMKIRQKMIYSYETQKAGEVLFKYVTPILTKTAAVLLCVPDPSGSSQIAGTSIGLAAAVTGGGGALTKTLGKMAKEHYCEKLDMDPSELKLKEQKKIIKKEKFFLKQTRDQ